MIRDGDYDINLDMENSILLLADINQKIVWTCHKYSIWDNHMISNIIAVILILLFKWSPYKVNIDMNTTRLWEITLKFL